MQRNPLRSAWGKPLRLWASIFFVVTVWSLSMPLFSGPDEPANFVKSAAVVRGEFVGDSYPASLQASYWSTYVDIDPKFGAANGIPWCFAPMKEKPACDVALEDAPVIDVPAVTNMGRYPPLPFFISGIGTFFGPNDLSVRTSRAVFGAVCAGFLTLALLIVRRRGVSVAPILVSVMPAVVFLAGTMSPSGLEIMAGIALWVASLGVFSDASGRFELVAFSLAGLAVIGARPIGPVIYVLIVGLSLISLFDRRHLPSRLRHARPAFIAHLIAMVMMSVWYLAVYDTQSSNSLVADEAKSPLLERIAHGFASIPRMFDEGFGDFGWLDTPMPRMALYVAIGLFAFVVGYGLMHSSKLSSFTVGAILAVVASMVVVIDLNYYELFRLYGVQGRHVMPVLVGVPIVAGWRMARSPSIDRSVAIVWAIVSIWSLAGALRRYAVGISPDNAFEMFLQPPWTPLLGIWPSLVLVVIASGAFAWIVPRD